MSAAPELGWSPRRPGHAPKADIKTLFENAPLYVAQVQPAGSITALNPALEQLLTCKSATGQTFRLADIVAPQDLPAAERLFKELFAGERDSFQLDAQCLAADSDSFRWTAWRVAGTAHNEECVLAVGEPAKKDPAADQRLRQAQRLEAVGRLAGGVAHDFNNLLTGVLLYCDLLLATVEPASRVRKYAEEIRKAGIQATGLVRQLLTLTRPANAQPRLLSLNEVAEGMRNLLVRLIGENIELALDLDPNLGLINMDSTQAQQVLLNLVLNSRDAMPSGGKVTIATSCCRVQILTASAAHGHQSSPPCALLVVGDTGTGMDEHTRAHLFEAFFTTKSCKGTGLGLATVHDIVTSHGGLIHVDSEPGTGTRISILLPLAPEAAANLPQITAEEQSRGELLLTVKE